jgi:hypothetical protein
MIRHVFLSKSAPGRSGHLSNDGYTAGRLKAEAHLGRTPGPRPRPSRGLSRVGNRGQGPSSYVTAVGRCGIRSTAGGEAPAQAMPCACRAAIPSPARPAGPPPLRPPRTRAAHPRYASDRHSSTPDFSTGGWPGGAAPAPSPTP